MKKQYFKTEKSYFNWLRKYKDKYKIVQVYLTKHAIACIYK